MRRLNPLYPLWPFLAVLAAVYLTTAGIAAIESPSLPEYLLSLGGTFGAISWLPWQVALRWYADSLLMQTSYPALFVFLYGIWGASIGLWLFRPNSLSGLTLLVSCCLTGSSFLAIARFLGF